MGHQGRRKDESLGTLLEQTQRAVQDFKLNMKAEGADFFSHFTFVDVDDVHGAHQFTSESEARLQKVISAGADGVQLKFGGIRAPSFDGEAKKRYAVNIHTSKAFDPSNGSPCACLGVRLGGMPSSGRWTVPSAGQSQEGSSR